MTAIWKAFIFYKALTTDPDKVLMVTIHKRNGIRFILLKKVQIVFSSLLFKNTYPKSPYINIMSCFHQLLSPSILSSEKRPISL